MLTAALGHRASLSAIMEFARSGRHVHLNLQAKDDSDFTALDYASVSGNGGLSDTIRGRSKTTPAPVKLTGGKMNNNTHVNNNARNVNNNNVNNNNNNVKGRQMSGKHQVATKPYKAGEEIELAEINPAALALRDSNLPTIQQFGKEVKSLAAQNDTNLSAIQSSSVSGSRPTSRNSSASSTGRRSRSQDRTASRPGSRAGGGGSSRSVERPGSKTASRPRGNSITNNSVSSEDDDLDLDLSSLRDLMGTVREAAKEIREIVEPIQKEGREGREQAARAREAHTRAQQARKHHKKHRRNSGHQQQIQAEIHVISEINGHPVPPLPQAMAPHPHPSDPQPAGLPATAYLHVENEELSHTWPRQKGRSVSRERVHRTLSGSGGTPGGGASSAGNTPVMASRNTGQAGHGAEHVHVDPGAARHEQEILNKVVGRYNGPDPLVSAINSINTTPKGRLIMESRQRIVGKARDHWNTYQPKEATAPPMSPPPSQSAAPLPQITVNEHEDDDINDAPRSAVGRQAPPPSGGQHPMGGRQPPSRGPVNPHPSPQPDRHQGPPAGPPSPTTPQPARGGPGPRGPARPGAPGGPPAGPQQHTSPAQPRPAPRGGPGPQAAPSPRAQPPNVGAPPPGARSNPGSTNTSPVKGTPASGPIAGGGGPEPGSKPVATPRAGAPGRPAGAPGPRDPSPTKAAGSNSRQPAGKPVAAPGPRVPVRR